MAQGRSLYLAASLIASDLQACRASAPFERKADQMRQDDRYIAECMHKKGYSNASQ
jgi:hypothetical protein